MRTVVEIAGRAIGPGHPCYIIAEIGINHNGDLDTALRLVDVAVAAGCDAVKFQKRTPDLCVPGHQKHVQRETPWGLMDYIDYKRRIEFGRDEFSVIDAHCRELGATWFASPWDVPSLEFLLEQSVPAVKVASAMLTNTPLLERISASGVPVILSTGMSTIDEIDLAVACLAGVPLILLHCTSTYPCPPEEINLSAMEELKQRYPGLLIGYSGHETGLQISLAAAALGAVVIERHITLDRAMWGSDHAASLEPGGLERLVRDIRVIERARGDGHKRVMPGEESIKRKLRLPG